MKSVFLSKPGRNFFKPVVLLNLLVIALLVFSTTVSAANTFRNPLNTDHGSDPFMVYYNGEYYLTATTWSTDPNVGVTVKHASTISGLIAATPLTIFKDTTASRCCNIWAPEFHFLTAPDGTQHWYLYYVAGVAADVSHQYIHVAESAGTSPLGPYTYKGRLYDPANDNWAVDPTILNLNGQLYLFWSGYEGSLFGSSQNIYGMAMSTPWTVTGSRALIARPAYSWETGTAAVNEGPEILQHGSTTFLVFSATWCGNPNYQLGRATYNGGNVLSQSSWVKYASPIFSAANGQYSTAHNGFFKSPDGTEDWIVYHGTTSSSGACDNTRTTRIQKFTWNADGTPNLGIPLSLTTDIQVPSGEGGVPALTDTPTPTSLPSQQDPITWYRFDESSGTIAADASGNAKTATLNGGATWVAGQSGNAVSLSGSSQYVSAPAGLVSNLNDFTIATWVRLNASGTWTRIFDFGSSTSVNMFLTPTTGANLRYAITTGGNGAEQQINASSPLSAGAWHHLAVTLSGTTGSLYLDGVQVGQNTSMTLRPSSLGNTGNNWIGRSQYAGDSYLNALVDDFRIYNRALSPAEVQSLASAAPVVTPTPSPTPTATLPPASTMWAQYALDGNASDGSGNGRNGTLNNSPTFVSGKKAQAVSLNGLNQSISLPAGLLSTLNDFTIAAWVNPSSISAWSRIFDFGSSSSVNMFLTPSTGSTLRFAITTGGSGGEQRINGSAPLTTGWHHLAVTLSGNLGTLYLDGIQVGQNTAMTLRPSSLGNTANNWIGRSQYSTDPYFNGLVDEFRIYARALSASEILALFQNP
jgi:GH43 family beta-xylosidase